MATYDKENLSFKASGKISPGCRYVIVVWKTGAPKNRRVATCHRKKKAAREKLPELKGAAARSRMSLGIYDLKTGKRVKFREVGPARPPWQR